MAMFVNYDGLTYEWNYEQSVIIKDGLADVDAFTLPWREHITTADFLHGVVHYANYLQEAHLYSSEEML